VSIISQSGGVVIDGIRLLTFENIGFNKSISIGNKLNLNECDYLSYFMSDPETQMIGMYLENFTDGRRLMALAQQTDKPIVILKPINPRPVTRLHSSIQPPWPEMTRPLTPP